MADDAMDDDDDDDDAEDSGAPAGALSLANTPTTPAAQTYAKQILDKTLAGGDLSGEQAMFKDLSDNTEAAKAALQTARDRLMAMRVSPQQEAWARAQAFLAPTRTGNFGDTLANYAGAQQNIYGQEQALQQKQASGDLDYSQQQSQLDSTLLNAKLKLAEMQQAQQNTLAGKALTTLGRPTAPASKTQFKTMDVGPGQQQNAWVDPVAQTVTPIGAPFAKTPDPGDDAQWTDSALFNAAVRYNTSGNLPSLGMGKTAAGNRKAIMDMAANLSTNPTWVPPSFASTGAVAPTADTANAQLQRGVDFKAAAKTVSSYDNGTDQKQINATNNAIGHMQLYKQMFDQLQNGSFRPGNALDQAWGKLWNKPAPTTLTALAQVVGPEITKSLVTTGAGAEGEREQFANTAGSLSNSPETTGAAIDGMVGLMGRQLADKEFNYHNVTGRTDFRTKYVPQDVASIMPGKLYSDATPANSGAAATPKALPTGARLSAYAAAHFGGDADKAAAFLKSQGYQ